MPPLELSTDWAEYNQGSVQHPATSAQLELTGARLGDLTAVATLRTLHADQDIHRCEWRAALDVGETPATHRLQARLIDYHHGVIYPSFMSKSGRCVALWR